MVDEISGTEQLASASHQLAATALAYFFSNSAAHSGVAAAVHGEILVAEQYLNYFQLREYAHARLYGLRGRQRVSGGGTAKDLPLQCMRSQLTASFWLSST